MSIPTTSEFLQIVQTNNSLSVVYKLGTVTELFADGSPKIKFYGEGTASEKKYPYIATYSPAIGDRLLITSVSGSYVILGKIKY